MHIEEISDGDNTNLDSLLEDLQDPKDVQGTSSLFLFVIYFFVFILLVTFMIFAFKAAFE